MLLDTDTVSALIRGRSPVVARGGQYLRVHNGVFTISIITRYEILRGYEAKQATTQAREFDRFCARNEVVPLNDEAVVHAARIYGDLYRRGELIGDADILIAATALVAGLGVVTNNEAHFGHIPGLTVENRLR